MYTHTHIWTKVSSVHALFLNVLLSPLDPLTWNPSSYAAAIASWSQEISFFVNCLHLGGTLCWPPSRLLPHPDRRRPKWPNIVARTKCFLRWLTLQSCWPLPHSDVHWPALACCQRLQREECRGSDQRDKSEGCKIWWCSEWLWRWGLSTECWRSCLPQSWRHTLQEKRGKKKHKKHYSIENITVTIPQDFNTTHYRTVYPNTWNTSNMINHVSELSTLNTETKPDFCLPLSFKMT